MTTNNEYSVYDIQAMVQEIDQLTKDKDDLSEENKDLEDQIQDLEDRFEEMVIKIDLLEKMQETNNVIAKHLPFLLGELEEYFCPIGFTSSVVERTVRHNIKDALRTLKEAYND
jgi:cell division septum initiation protein DivIVA